MRSVLNSEPCIQIKELNFHYKIYFFKDKSKHFIKRKETSLK